MHRGGPGEDWVITAGLYKVHVHVPIHVNMHVSIQVHMHMSIHVHMHVSMHVHMHMHVCAYAYACMCICMGLHMCICTLSRRPWWSTLARTRPINVHMHRWSHVHMHRWSRLARTRSFHGRISSRTPPTISPGTLCCAPPHLCPRSSRWLRGCLTI